MFLSLLFHLAPPITDMWPLERCPEGMWPLGRARFLTSALESDKLGLLLQCHKWAEHENWDSSYHWLSWNPASQGQSTCKVLVRKWSSEHCTSPEVPYFQWLPQAVTSALPTAFGQAHWDVPWGSHTGGCHQNQAELGKGVSPPHQKNKTPTCWLGISVISWPHLVRQPSSWVQLWFYNLLFLPSFLLY